MTTATKQARGTSAFTYPDPPLYSPAQEATVFSAAEQAESEHPWDRIIDELLRIQFFQDDWDGEGSVAPDSGVVAGAIKLVQIFKADKFAPADRVIASVNGTVYFEWHTPLGYREIEVTSPLDAESRWVPAGSNKTEVVPITLGS
jgi:hypothetical protein